MPEIVPSNSNVLPTVATIVYPSFQLTSLFPDKFVLWDPSIHPSIQPCIVQHRQTSLACLHTARLRAANAD